MLKNIYKSRKKISYQIIFYVMFVYSFTVIYLNYEITLSPDFDKYFQYLEYYSGLNTSTNLEQGNFYFFGGYAFSSFVKIIYSDYFNYEILNFSILSFNFLIYMFGLLGLKNYLKLKGFKEEIIYLVLIVCTFLPISFQLRMSFKPEILAFSILVWSLLFIEKYLILKEPKWFNLFLTSLLILLNLKVSISVMVGVFYIVFFINKKMYIILKKNYKKLIYFFLCFLIIFSENYILNGSFLHQAEHDEKYNNQADLEFFTNFNSYEVKYNPRKDTHNNSFRAITLFDTFSDYFELYWNADHTNLNKFRKNIVVFQIPDDVRQDSFYEIEYNKERKEFKVIGNIDTVLIARDIGENILNELRMKTAFIFSLILFTLSLILIVLKRDLRYIFISPFVGLLLVALSSAGLFTNNHDPAVGDSVKPFYYGFFIILSFALILSLVLSYFKKTKIFLSIGTVILFLFIIGLPQSYDQLLIENQEYKNSLIPTCAITSIVIDHYEFNLETTCKHTPDIKNIRSSQYEGVNLKFKPTRFPYFNLLTILIFMINYFKIKTK